tara:strand:+ start:8453 stop:9148 length:696 start_codon:yes stop_codon:yes gene_type:complete
MKSCIAKVFGSFFLFLSGLTIADNQAMIETDKQKFSYTIGYQIGNQLAEQVVREKIDIDVDTFMKAIDDAFLNRSPLMTDDEMKESLSVYQLQAMEKQNAMAESGRMRGQDYRTDYGRRSDVVATKSGLQYRIIESGAGRSPGPTDTVVVHYVGRLIDGSVFDSSRARGNPATFSLDSIIKGWREVLQIMVEGDIWEVVIPPELAYGAQGAGASIGPNETLVFEIELIAIK